MKIRALLASVLLVCSLPLAALAVDPQIYFSRSDPVANVILREINGAKKSIHLLMYSLTDHEIADALIAAAKRGVDVKIVFDKSQGEEKNSLTDEVIEALGPKRAVYRNGKGRGIMHEKMAIYDGLTVTLGSYNWTNNAKANNWENLIVLRDTHIASECSAEFQRVWQSPEPGTPASKSRKGR
jgi:phosphatidylserine/phosphatidylglycerophosphate/cardiolipin synthase-like enzyme